MTGISVNAHLNEILTNDSVLSGMTQDIYPIVAEEDVKFPFIIHMRDGIAPIDTKNIIVGDKVQFSIAVVSDKYITGVTIAERVRKILDKRRDGYFSDCLLIGATEDYINDAYVQRLRFAVTIFANNN